MIWSCFPPQKLTIIQVKKLAKMSVQVFVTHVPHATNGEHPWSSLLFAGHPKPLQWDFCLDHLCTSSRKTGAKLFAANSVTPSFKKKSLKNVHWSWRMSIFVESHHENDTWSLSPGSPFGIIRKIFHKGFRKLGRFWTKCTSYNSVRSPTKNLYIGNIWDWLPQIFGQSDGIDRIGRVSCTSNLIYYWSGTQRWHQDTLSNAS